jgi:AcrR family transcriptional regulator
VSPKVADPAVRSALIETAARLLATEGPEALTLRRLADEVGTSTMAVYTHFGGMPELRRALRREGFARLADFLDGVARTRDPVADLIALGYAYFQNAVTNPHLYRAMFMEHGVEPADVVIGVETFETLVGAVQRCIETARVRLTDAVAVATHLWALTHGIAMLHLAGFLSVDQALDSFGGAGRSLLLGYGDERPALDRSMARARRRIPAMP